MKKKITLFIAGAVSCFQYMNSQVACQDLNGYVNHKNSGGTSAYQLQAGYEEMAAQTYNYSGPGKVSSIRVYGAYPNTSGGVPLKVGVYNVDVNGRPTTLIQSVNTIWWSFDNPTGYINVSMPNGGVSVNSRFAVTIQLLNTYPFGTVFNLQYTGNGEGGGEDLASLAGTSTGQNWSSAKNNFGKDGDFYLVPDMTNYITSDFVLGSICYSTNAAVSFSNTTSITKNAMFNRILLSGYSGTNTLYSWNFGDGSAVSTATNPSHTYTLAGVYTISLTSKIDGWNGVCANTYTSKISVGLSGSASGVSSVSCYGASTGSLTVSAQGGSPGYLYSLDGISYQSGGTFSALSAGTKTVYVKDGLSCVNSSDVSILQSPAIIFSALSSTVATCGNLDGAISTSALGGNGTLQFKLDNGAYQSAASFTGLAAGFHTVTAQDANACLSSTLAGLNDVGGPIINSAVVSNVTCFNGSNGSIVVSATTAAGNLQYSINGGALQSSGTFSNLSAGVYAVLVKNANFCIDLVTVTVNQPAPLSVNATAVPATCYGTASGQIKVLSSAGGTGSHNYSINGSNYQSGLNFSSLAAGTHTLYVKDAANCTISTTMNVTQPASVTAITSTTLPSCNGSADGSIGISATGGAGGIEYSLNGQNYQPTGMFTNLSAGSYYFNARDAQGCLFVSFVNLSQPAAINTTVGTTNSTCGNSNGAVLVLASGGTGGFQYSLNGSTFNSTGMFNLLASGTYYVLLKDNSTCKKVVPANIVDSNGPTILSQSHVNVSCNGGSNGSISITNVTGGSGTLLYSINGINWQSSSQFSGLPAGVYLVTVKDANGCTGVATVTLSQPNAFIVNPIVNNVTCAGGATGSSTITAAGGAGVLAFSINGGQSYQSSNIFSGLTAGTYYITIKDAANCQGFGSFTVTEPTPINASVGVLNVLCHGDNSGAVMVFASGGTGSLQYSIDGVNYSSSNFIPGLLGNMNYVVYVKDANNCIKALPFYVNEPAPLSVGAVQNNVSCAQGNNGAINLSVSGGVSPYTFHWSNGSSTQGIFNLTAGVYSVSLSDYNGCNATNNFTVTQPANPLLINAAVQNTSGNGNDGAIDITVTGGTPPYQFSWSNNATTEDLNGLAPGAYLITVTDAGGCVSASTFIVGNILGIAEAGAGEGNILLYPNPASNYVTLEIKGKNIDRLEVYNLLGQKMLVAEPHSESVNITTAGLLRGSYLVRIYVGENVAVKRLVLAD